jgi:predicted dehydrogenase
MKLRTIHVGVAARGTWPLDVMGKDDRFQPVALVDLSQAALDAGRAMVGLSPDRCFNDLSRALDAVDADAVILCTPTKTHGPLSRIAFDRGKHVLVEKGMTMDFNEAKSLVAHAEKANVKFCVSQNYRYTAGERTITHLLNTPDHPHHPGRPMIVDYVSHRYRPEPRTLNYPDAMIWDMSCHHVDSLACWLGEAKSVQARSWNAPWSKYEHDSNITAVIEYASGAICNYTLTHSATLSCGSLIIQGERGALRSHDGQGVRFYPLPARHLGSSDPVPCDIISSEQSEKGVAGAFHDYIARGIEPGISGRMNLQTLAVCEMLSRSAREKRIVTREELA